MTSLVGKANLWVRMLWSRIIAARNYLEGRFACWMDLISGGAVEGCRGCRGYNGGDFVLNNTFQRRCDGLFLRRPTGFFAALCAALGRRGYNFFLLTTLWVGRWLPLLGLPKIRRILLTEHWRVISRLARPSAGWLSGDCRIGYVDGGWIRVSRTCPSRSVD